MDSERISINGREYTRKALEDAFDMVANPDDWRAPIDAHVTTTDIRDGSTIKAAVAFFTGTEATIRLESDVDQETFELHVTALGYRMGPCGP